MCNIFRSIKHNGRWKPSIDNLYYMQIPRVVILRLNLNKQNLCTQICPNMKSDCSSTGEHEIIVVTQLSANHLILAARLRCLFKPE